MKLMPWGGAAARLSSRQVSPPPAPPSAPLAAADDFGVGILAAAAAEAARDWPRLKGQAFCFLPLPAETGLPVHANGYFELSANRRDIWYGTDMMGAGKLRSDWNCALLEDVVAPSYVELLLCARTAVPSMAQYYQLWPQQRPAEPWGLLVDQLYASLLDQPVLRTEANHGRWVSPTEAVFAEPAEDGDEAAAAMRAALLRSGMPLVVVPKAVFELLQRAAQSTNAVLTTANARTVRLWLQGSWSGR